MLQRIEHVQLAMPKGEEGRARAFYRDLLGLPEIQKPARLAASGGAWFERGELKVHLGVEEDFRPARKAHAAFVVDDLAALAGALEAAGSEVILDDRLPGYDRFFTSDPFGNRLEFMAPRSERSAS